MDKDIDKQKRLDDALVEYLLGDNPSVRHLSKKYGITRYLFTRYLNKKGIVLTKRKYHFDENYFEKIDTEEKAYWLGFITADGHVSHKMMVIMLSATDTKHLSEFANIFNIPIREYDRFIKQKTRRVVSASLCSVKVANDLRAKGLTHNKTFDLDDSIFNFIPEPLIHHFIRGFFDGDGSISAKNRNNSMISLIGVKSFLLKIKEYILLGARVNDTQLIKYRDTSHDQLYYLRFSGNRQVMSVKKYLYSNATIYLDRKKNVFDSISRYYCKNKNSKYCGVGKYYGNKWASLIYIDNKLYRLGVYTTELEAAKAYDAFIDKNNLPEYRKNFPEK